MLPIDAALAHPDVRMGGVAHNPVELAPLLDAVADGGLGEIIAVPLREYKSTCVSKRFLS